MNPINAKSWKMTLPDGTTIDSDNLKISRSDNYTQPHIPIPSISIEGTIKVKKRALVRLHNYLYRKRLPRKLKKAWRKNILKNIKDAGMSYRKLVFDRYRGWTLYPIKNIKNKT